MSPSYTAAEYARVATTMLVRQALLRAPGAETSSQPGECTANPACTIGGVCIVTGHTALRLLLVVLLSAFVTELAACHRLSLGGGAVKPPAGWPLPALGAPTGSAAAEYRMLGAGRGLSENGAPVSSPAGITEKRYSFGFKNSLGWEGNVSHVEQVLKPLGYVILTDASQRRKSYFSPDLKTKIAIEYQQADDCFVLEATTYSPPWPQPFTRAKPIP